MRHDLVAEIFERRGNRQRRSLPETADRGELHGLGQLADQVNFSGLGLATCSAVENLDDFVAAHPARDAFAARLVAEKRHHIQRNIQHTSSLGQGNHCARAQHGPDLGQGLKIKSGPGHRGRQEA